MNHILVFDFSAMITRHGKLSLLSFSWFTVLFLLLKNHISHRIEVLMVGRSMSSLHYSIIPVMITSSCPVLSTSFAWMTDGSKQSDDQKVNTVKQVIIYVDLSMLFVVQIGLNIRCSFGTCFPRYSVFFPNKTDHNKGKTKKKNKRNNESIRNQT